MSRTKNGRIDTNPEYYGVTPYERKIIKAVKCVRMPADVAEVMNIGCAMCPLFDNNHKNCDRSCGFGHYWVDELTYITKLMEKA